MQWGIIHQIDPTARLDNRGQQNNNPITVLGITQSTPNIEKAKSIILSPLGSGEADGQWFLHLSAHTTPIKHNQPSFAKVIRSEHLPQRCCPKKEAHLRGFWIGGLYKKILRHKYLERKDSSTEHQPRLVLSSLSKASP
jgi:hypothetical protein